MTAPIYVGIAATVALSCGWDLRTRRIPNLLTASSAAAALSVHTLENGASGLLFGLAGCLIGVLLFMPWFLAGGMGGGDVKLLGAFGAWLGPPLTIRAALFAMVAGGVMALVVMCASETKARAAEDRAGRRFFGKGGAAIAYAVPIATGVGLALWLR